MTQWPFDSVLIANRGEIALRIIRSVHALGLRSAAVFSEADFDAPHVRAADRAVLLGPAPAAKSYLDGAALISAARATGAGAIHPGYGFLSENAAFAQACADSGLIFIGPGAEAIRVMGNKRLAKERMQAAGVPCIPGYAGQAQDAGRFREAASEIGYPVMVKAAAGGGGRGMRLVHGEADLESAVQAAASEARNAFGDGTLYLEKALQGARHIEVQILADRHGNTLHLGERDCSIQRRHQKIVEESPSPVVGPALRARMTADAVSAARSIGYENAGTVEFLLDSDQRYYFLEMNTRLQVEHPVTELVTGLDLVELQLRIAAGEPLALQQKDVVFTGHAIEVRLCAEDPGTGFLPQSGQIGVWQPAENTGVRIDAGIASGQVITPFYDSMLAKIIAHGKDRDEARRRLATAVERTVITGVPTNKDYLARILRHPQFAAGTATTEFVAQLTAESAPPEPTALAAVAALIFCWPERMSLSQWGRAGEGRWLVRLAGGPARVERDRTGLVTVHHPDNDFTLRPISLTEGQITVLIDNVLERVRFLRLKDGIELMGLGTTRRFIETLPEMNRAAGPQGQEQLAAPISGRVIRIAGAVGDNVAANTCLLVIEAMKMECEIRTRGPGIVKTITVEVGAQVATRQVLATLEPA
jgi:geranyl-CoA carboxylase alpha subunit